MNNNMVLVFQQLCHKAREMVPVKNKLFLKDMHFKGFPLSILRWVLFFISKKCLFSEIILKRHMVNDNNK